MAIVFDSSSNNGVATGSATVTVSHTTGSGSNRFMIVGVSHSKDDPTINSVAYGGVALTALGTAQTSDFRTRIYTLVNPASGTANLVVTFSANLLKGAIVNVTTFTGVDQTTPTPLALSQASGDSTAPSTTVTSAVDYEVYDVLCTEIGSGTITPGAGQTLNGTVPTDRELVTQRSSRETATGVSTTMSYTLGTAKKWSISGIAIEPASEALSSSSMFMVL